MKEKNAGRWNVAEWLCRWRQSTPLISCSRSAPCR